MENPEKSASNETLLKAAQRVRLCVRLMGAALILACLERGGAFWAWGAFFGLVIVEINLHLLGSFLKAASMWRGSGLRPTLTRFYLAFGLTALACFLVVRNEWGHPAGFLIGLLSFALGLLAALLSLAAFPVKPS